MRGLIILNGLLLVICWPLVGDLEAKTANLKELKPTKSNFLLSFPATATVEPLIKVEVNPPVSGRIENVLVEEGQTVKKGEILAYMSSTDRAALLDAAKTESKKSLKKWEQMYRPIALVSPISGKILKGEIVAGQNVTPSTGLFTIADKLIIKAQVDETDVGKVIKGQMAKVRADAFPKINFLAKVKRIAHQSKLVNNVNIYQVILESNEMPKGIRSGMGASAHFTISEKMNAILLPAWIAEGLENTDKEILVLGKNGKPFKKTIALGQSDGKMVEVKKNLSENDIVLYTPVKFTKKKKNILGF